MRKSFYDLLPRDYFGGLYGKVTKKLKKHQNVLVSAMYGCGGKTFVNFFINLAQKQNLFQKIIYYDPTIADKDLIDWVKAKIGSKNNNLVLIRKFEVLEDKQNILEKLNSLRYPNPENLTFLVVTNHLSITKPGVYLAKTSQFFSDWFYIQPFSRKETELVIEINNKFYGWAIKKELVDDIYTLTGGVPRLIKYTAKSIEEQKFNVNNFKSLVNNPSMHYQLKYFTKLLITVDNEKLKNLGLISENGKILSKLLNTYFNRYINENIKHLYPNLSNLEQKILTYLIEADDEIVSIDKIGDLLEANGSEFSLWAIYKHISRIKPKISGHYKIKNIKGKGYMLEKI